MYIEGNYDEIVRDLDNRSHSTIFNGHGMVDDEAGNLDYANFGLFSINECHFDRCIACEDGKGGYYKMSFSNPELNEKIAEQFVLTGREAL